MDLVGPSATADADWVSGGEWLDPYPTTDPAGPAESAERRETLELAFLAAIQHLSPAQRAVLVLREVLRFSALEVAGILDTTVIAVNSSLQRARRDLRVRLDSSDQHTELAALGDEVRRLARCYVDAWERGDVDAVVRLLIEDATFQMPPYPVWFRGRATIAAFLPVGPMRYRWRIVPTRANGQLAFACYITEPQGGTFVAHSIDVIEVRGDRIASITAFHGAELVARFGLPSTLGARGSVASCP